MAVNLTGVIQLQMTIIQIIEKTQSLVEWYFCRSILNYDIVLSLYNSDLFENYYKHNTTMKINT